MIYMFITNEPDMAEFAWNSGVNRIFVDMEWMGKYERQGFLDTHMALSTSDDVAAIRNRLPEAEIMTRINPVHSESYMEIDSSIEAGTDVIMLPMFKTADEVEKTIRLIDGRVRLCLLLETPEALTRIDDILEYSAGIDEIHLGLNDLHLSMGLDFMFELLSGGMVEYAARKIQNHDIRFGFGGVARVGRKDAVPAKLILGEHIRLHSEMVILSRAFRMGINDVSELKDKINLPNEIKRLDECLDGFRKSNDKQLEENRRKLVIAVRNFVSSKREAMTV
jgi:2-keto-3-deoxy-L-rhamnonate aldolase RhmA